MSSAQVWINKIGKYELKSLMGSGNVMSPDETKEACEHFLTNPAAQNALYQGCSNNEVTEKREAFLEYLYELNQSTQHRQHISVGSDLQPVELKKLLGQKGFELFKAAAKEEAESKQFRDAVFMHSMQHVKGPKWNKRLVLWIGGPSASGKSHGAKIILDRLNKRMSSDNPQDNSGNYILNIDGGKEREISQIRQMVLQVALAKGFSGIEDLEQHSKFSIKKSVMEAAKQQQDINMLIPATFNSGNLEKEMDNFTQDKNTTQAFAMVKGMPGYGSKFKRMVTVQGNKRAWYNKTDKVGCIDPVKDVFINNREIGCESKKYDSMYYTVGKFYSSRAKKHLKKTNPNALIMDYINDSIFVYKNKKNQWVECDDPNIDATRVHIAGWIAWQEYQKKGLQAFNLSNYNTEQKDMITALCEQKITDFKIWYDRCVGVNLFNGPYVSDKSHKSVVTPSVSGGRPPIRKFAASESDLPPRKRTRRTPVNAHSNIAINGTRPLPRQITLQQQASMAQKQISNICTSQFTPDKWQCQSHNRKFEFKKINDTNKEKQFTVSAHQANTLGYTLAASNVDSQKSVGKMAQALVSEMKQQAKVTIVPGDDFVEAIIKYAESGLDMQNIKVELPNQQPVSVISYIEQYADLAQGDKVAAINRLLEANQFGQNKLNAKQGG